jgi:uncharacterized protein with HEPN domain
MRNRLIHGYDTIDYVRVEETVEQDLPPLIEALRAAIAGLESEQSEA